jgi:hypothetical protein
MATESGGAGEPSSDADDAVVDEPSPDPSRPIVVSLLVSPDPMLPFQHAAEVSIAAYQGHVVIASINLHTDGVDTIAAASLLRGVGVAVSHDGGRSFAPAIDPGFAVRETSDPVVRATPDGTMWVSAIGVELAGQPGETHRGFLLQSRDQARSWTVVHDNLAVWDKEWLAPMATGELVMGADGGFWKFASDGSIAASWVGGPDWPVFGAFAEPAGARFAIASSSVVRWTGAQFLSLEGRLVGENMVADVGWSVPMGPIAGGGFWAAYGYRLQSAQRLEGSVRLRVFAPQDTVGQEVLVSASGSTAFMPAAAPDAEGRVHLVWYDSTGPAGVLHYARSVSADLHEGFSAPRVVDDNACPGNGWLPSFGEDAPDRRLREYIDLAVDRRRVHIAWTHAPMLPSRVFTSHLDF